MKKLSQQVTYWLGVIIVGLIVGLGIQFVQAWTNPPFDPPSNNLGAPINTSVITQTKSGDLIANNLGAINVTATNVTAGALNACTDSATSKIYADTTGRLICGTDQASAGGGITQINQGAGITLSPSPIISTGTISLNTAGISSCTNSTTSKIYWDSGNSRLICGTDQTGAGDSLWTDAGSYIYANNATNVTVTDSSKIGIGTNNPSDYIGWGNALEVVGQVKAVRYYDDSGSTYYADLNSGGNLNGNWTFNNSMLSIKTPGYSSSTLQIYARDIRTSANEDLYLNWNNASGNVNIGGEGEKKVLYMAGATGATGAGSYVDAPDYYIRSTNKWASQMGAGVITVSSVYSCSAASSESNCPIGVHKVCFLTAANVYEDSESNDPQEIRVTGVSGGDWTLHVKDLMDEISASAICLDW